MLVGFSKLATIRIEKLLDLSDAVVIAAPTKRKDHISISSRVCGRNDLGKLEPVQLEKMPAGQPDEGRFRGLRAQSVLFLRRLADGTWSVLDGISVGKGRIEVSKFYEADQTKNYALRFAGVSVYGRARPIVFGKSLDPGSKGHVSLDRLCNEIRSVYRSHHPAAKAA